MRIIGKAVLTLNCSCQMQGPGSFRDWYEFRTIEAALGNSHDWTEVRVAQPYLGGLGFVERWFQCKQCGETWRLVSPDPPFAGLWELVQSVF